MPELPEVETIRTELEPLLLGRRILSATASRMDIIGYPDPRRFRRGIAGARVAGLARRGKYLIVRLDTERELLFHLRLSGRLEVRGPSRPRRFERIRFELDNGRSLAFVEPRVLGRVYLTKTGDYPAALAGMLRMGPEPIQPGFTASYLAAKLARRRSVVKNLLLDQRVCCGVGNIYADEALARAGIRPTRMGGSLKQGEINRLARALRAVLKEGIRWCGTTLADERYLRPGRQAGSFQRRLRVHGREGSLCRMRGCTGVVERRRIGNRSSYYCPVCQR